MIHQPQRRIPLAVILSIAAMSAANGAGSDPAMTFDLLGPGHTIEMQSLQWGAGLAMSTAMGAGERSVSQPSVSEITWSQAIDTTVPLLQTKLLKQAITEKASMKLFSPTGTFDSPYLSLDTKDVVVTSVSQSYSGASGSASTSIGYTQFSLTYDPQPLGKTGG